MISLDKYAKSFKMGMLNAMEYRADFILSIFSAGFIIIIQCFLWTAVFASSTEPVVYGYTFPEMISYSIIAGLTSKMVSAGFEWEIANDIKNGGLSKFVVQPVSYFYYRICCFFGGKTVQLSILLVLSMGALMACGAFLGLELNIYRILMFFPFVFLAMVLNFLIYYSISSLAFTMTEVWGVFAAAGQGILMLSGGIFPLDVFGDKVNRALSMLPFKYIIFYPVNIINGRIPPEEVYSGAVVLLAWIAVLAVISKICWRSGMKKFVAAGG